MRKSHIYVVVSGVISCFLLIFSKNYMQNSQKNVFIRNKKMSKLYIHETDAPFKLFHVPCYTQIIVCITPSSPS